MAEPLIIAKSAGQDLAILPALANRHGLITGATGTGKTVTLQKMAECFSEQGVPVFVADIKGDLSGVGSEGVLSDRLRSHLEAIGVENWRPTSSPVVLWDVFGEKGHPVRATVTDMGPVLLGRLMNLNEIQTGILQLVFKIADDNNLLLLNMKDLRAMVKFVGDNAKKFTTEYGNISTASIGAIQRSLLTLEQQGAEHFFGEPMLDINDLMRFNIRGQGVVNILSAEKLHNHPQLYSVFLLWLLSELFEQLPEVGDMEKPKMVFFFDEAHMLFTNISPALLQKIEQVVRLIRSKGIGIYFVTQNPTDIPDSVLSQLGNRVQHALRAFTVRDQKAVKAAAQTMRTNPALDAEKAISELAVGEALVSFLDEKGRPNMVERAFIIAPGSRMGPMNSDEVNIAINQSSIYGKYEDTVDRESAYEKITAGFTLGSDSTNNKKPDGNQSVKETSGGFLESLSALIFGSKGPRGGQKDGIVQTATKTATRQIANQIGRQIFRGILGGISGGRKK